MSLSTRRGGRLSRPPRLAVLLIAMALAIACGAGAAARRGPDKAKAKPNPTKTTTCRTGDPQRLLLAAGENPYDAGLYRVDVCAGTASRVGNYGRISSLAAAAGVVAVAAAPERNDYMFRLHGSELRPLIGTHPPRGSSPAVSTDGRRVAYVEVAAEFLLREVVNGKLRTLHRSKKPLSVTAYTPSSGALLVAEISEDVSSASLPEPAQLLSVGTDGRTRKFAQLPSPTIDGVAVSRSGDVAVSLGEHEPGVILDQTGRVRGTIAPRLRVLQYLRSGELLVLSQDNRLGRFPVGGPLSGATPTWIDLPAVGAIVGVSEQ